MNKIFRGAWQAAIFSFVTAQGAQAQGIGPLLDWISKLSGPQLWGGGLSVYTPVVPSKGEEGVRFRISGVYRTSYDEAEEIDPDDASIQMITLRPEFEFPLPSIPVDLGAGFAFHRFQGDDFQSFWHWSVPFRAQLRVPIGRVFRFRAGLSLNIYPAFDAGDFAPLIVNVSTDKAEAVFGALLGFDLELFNLR